VDINCLGVSHQNCLVGVLTATMVAISKSAAAWAAPLTAAPRGRRRAIHFLTASLCKRSSNRSGMRLPRLR
jgi:hypothetical protein